MDIDAERQKLENARDFVKGWLAHPITESVIRNNKESQEKFIDLLCNQPIHNIETFFAHFEAIGHLRGLRQSSALVQEQLDVVIEQLKELPDDK
jgi:hypothetical protein